MKFDKNNVCVAGLHDVPVGTRGYCANTVTQLESRVVTEYESDVCVIYGIQDGYYCVQGKAYKFDGTMFYPLPEKKYRPFETIEEAQVMKGKWIRSKDRTIYLQVTILSINQTTGNLYINGYSSYGLFENHVIDETGEPVGVEV